MQSKNTKYILLAAVIFMLGVTIYNIGNSFALFESNFTIVTESSTGSWNILINNVDITGATNTFTVNNVNITGNNHVISNKMAPGTSAYFDVNIVPTGTEVSIRYDLTFDFSLLSTSLVVDEISELNNRTLVRTGENTYSGIITLAEIENNVVSNVRVNILWDNDENNNEIDTALGMDSSGSISIPVQIDVTQYLGEVLVEYE